LTFNFTWYNIDRNISYIKFTEMIKIQGQLPPKFILACSGGVDSMSVLDFVRKKHDVIVLHINHQTVQAHAMQRCVEDYCSKVHIDNLIIKNIQNADCPEGKSREEHWRNERYKIIDEVAEDFGVPAITVHHLDDCIETWIWSAMHGNPKIVPYHRNRVIRPFRLTPKTQFRQWAETHDVPYVEDASNAELRYTRNYVRHVCVPHVKHINPGIEKTISKKILNEVVEYE